MDVNPEYNRTPVGKFLERERLMRIEDTCTMPYNAKFLIPLPGGKEAVLAIWRPLSEDQVNHLIAWLEFSRHALVSHEEGEALENLRKEHGS